jgi:TetR/AcrR family acrAB operon transcriptional repressor
MRKTKEDTAATRKAILEAALAVFSRQGYAAARLEDIANEAGVTRGAIYWHFASKADLYNTLVGEVSARGDVVINEAVAQGGTFIERCRRIMIRLLEYLEEDEAYRSVMELTLFKTEFTPELEAGIRMKAEGMKAAETTLTHFIKGGIDSGQVRADLDPVIGARALLAYLNGITITWMLDQKAYSLRASAPALVDVYIMGIAAKA